MKDIFYPAILAIIITWLFVMSVTMYAVHTPKAGKQEAPTHSAISTTEAVQKISGKDPEWEAFDMLNVPKYKEATDKQILEALIDYLKLEYEVEQGQTILENEKYSRRISTVGNKVIFKEKDHVLVLSGTADIK